MANSKQVCFNMIQICWHFEQKVGLVIIMLYVYSINVDIYCVGYIFIMQPWHAM